jgi:hypothetical protein
MAVEMAGMLDRKVREGSKNGYVNRKKGEMTSEMAGILL